jgi:hypothetical protein
MCDISFTNGKGLLGQVINKIHEDKLINTTVELEPYLLKRDNDIPNINNKNNQITQQNNQDNTLDIKILNDIQRWLYIYHNSNYELNGNDTNINLLIKRASVLEDALKILINDYTLVNNEFMQNIHLTDKDKITNLQLTEVYDIPLISLSQKWNIILKYQYIFKNLYNILDENMKKMVEFNNV